MPLFRFTFANQPDEHSNDFAFFCGKTRARRDQPFAIILTIIGVWDIYLPAPI